MSEYRKLQDEFDKKIKDLQDNCPHEEFGEEQDEYWAPGHTTGARVKYCKRCWYKVYLSGYF
jgi:hypothetical protein